MSNRFFSSKDRPVHMGPYPTELLGRIEQIPELSDIPKAPQISYCNDTHPTSIINAMREHQAMMDAIRDGLINKTIAETPTDLVERANHLKSFGYFSDAALVGTCLLHQEALLASPYSNPDVNRLAHDLKTRQTNSLAAGMT